MNDDQLTKRTCPACGCKSDEIRDGKRCPHCNGTKAVRPNPFVPREKR